jgi:hypothetical protein
MRSTIVGISLASLVMVGLAVGACSSNDSSGGYGGSYYGSGATGGSGPTGGSGGSGGSAAAAGIGGGVDSGADGASCVDLTVLNYLSWCSVSVAGATASTDASQTACVPAGAVSLSATALVGFRLGTAPWHKTDGDRGSGEQGSLAGDTSTATVTVSGANCVWVCCEFAAGGGCPTTNQCP